MNMHDKGVTTAQSVDASINENNSYTYILPSAKGSVSQISTPALHASASTVTTDANGNSVYNYTPTADYVGSDVVVVTTQTEGGHSGCQGGPSGPGGNCNHGNCCNHDGNTTITTISMTVAPVNQSVRRSQGTNKSLSSTASSN